MVLKIFLHEYPFLKPRLWEEPYFSQDTGPQDEKLLELACNLSPTLEMDQMFVLGGLR